MEKRAGLFEKEMTRHKRPALCVRPTLVRSIPMPMNEPFGKLYRKGPEPQAKPNSTLPAGAPGTSTENTLW